MANLTAISHEQHGKKRWLRHPNYKFASADAISPLVADELAAAVQNMPVAFVKQGDSFILVAVQGLISGENLLVSLDGRWLANYTPIAYRYNPFLLLKNEQGNLVLCMDEASNLLTDQPEGEKFFEENGEPTQQIQDILNRLIQIENSRKYTQVVCDLLNRLNLIQPWPITLVTADGEKTVTGLFRVDEPALNSLTAEELLELRDCGALPVIYCQLLSMQHLNTLQTLHSHRINAMQEKPKMNETFDFSSLN